MRERGQPAQHAGSVRPPTARPSIAGRPSRSDQLLGLQRSAGNQAVAGLLGAGTTQAAPSRDRPATNAVQRTPPAPTLDVPAADPAVQVRQAAEQALRPAIAQVMAEASKSAEVDFAAKLPAAVGAALAASDPAERDRAVDVAKQIAAIHQQIALPGGGGADFDIPALLGALDGVHRDATGLAGVDASAGVRQVIRTLDEHATSAIVEAMPGGASYSGLYMTTLRGDIAAAAAAVGDATALLRLELEGTINELVAARGAFASATEQAARAQAGAVVGETARKAILLDKALQEATKTSAGGPTPLDAEVGRRAADIARIRQTAATEEATRGAMGDQLTLLAEQQVSSTRGSTDDQPADTMGDLTDAAVQPEEAFPAATDAAERSMAGELSSRIGQQRSEVAELHGKVVPEHPSYTLQEFAAVHRRWYSLYSGEQERMDPVMQLGLGLLGEPYRTAGMDVGSTALKAEGGVVRAMLMTLVIDMMANSMHGETAQFGAQIDQAAPARTASTSGSAGDVQYRYGQLYAGAGGDASRGGEVRSRQGFEQRREQETGGAVAAMAALPPQLQEGVAERAGMVSGPPAPIVDLHTDEARRGWSYLTDVTSPMGDLVAREHKVVPPEVAAYLLAARQQTATLATPHIPTADGRPIGSRATRTQGVETAAATSAERRVEGAANPPAPAEVANLQGQLAAARRETGVQAGQRPPTSTNATATLGAELRSYLDGFFAERQSIEYRLAAIFAIADTEHGVGKQLMGLLEPGRLAGMIAEALKISAIMAVLEALGPLGQLASNAFGAYLSSQGVSDVAALISVAAFCKNAADADGLDKARAWGYATVNIADDAEQLFTSLVTTTVTTALHAVTTAKPATPRELADAVRPLMADPVAREALLRDVEAHIAQLEAAKQSSSELESLRAFRDALLQRSTAETAAATEARLPGAKERKEGDAEPGAFFTATHERSAKEKEALRNVLGADVPLVENTGLTGDAVHVRYDEHGNVHVEIGPAVEPHHLRQHLEAIHELRKYEGVTGKIRQLLSHLAQLITGHPAFGTEGFEARLEVQKLRGIEADLQAELRAVEAHADRLTGHDGVDLAREGALIRSQIESIQHQLAGHEAKLGSYESGRGFIAAEDTSPTMTAARERARALIAKAEAAAPGVRDALGKAVAEHGGTLSGLEFELKSEESLTRKIHDRTMERGDTSAKAMDKITSKMNDSLRYTAVIDAAHYMTAYRAVRASLEAAGYKPVPGREGNAWAEPERFGGGYRGINATFRTPDGLEFEVQFHTQESLDLKQEQHALYEEYRDPATSPERKRELNQQRRKLAEALAVPPGAADLGAKP
jgi:hypothetical protein